MLLFYYHFSLRPCSLWSFLWRSSRCFCVSLGWWTNKSFPCLWMPYFLSTHHFQDSSFISLSSTPKVSYRQTESLLGIFGRSAADVFRAESMQREMTAASQPFPSCWIIPTDETKLFTSPTGRIFSPLSSVSWIPTASYSFIFFDSVVHIFSCLNRVLLHVKPVLEVANSGTWGALSR